MPLSYSVDQVDENGREMLTYGTEDFPIAFFDDDLTKVAVPYHWHDELEIVLVTEGIVRVWIGGSEFTLSSGEGYFANSGILHAAKLLSPAGHQHAMVFSPRIVSQAEDAIWNICIAPVLGNTQLPFIRLTSSAPWQKEVLALAEAAWRQGVYEKKDYPLHVRHCISQAFSLIASHRNLIADETHYTDKFQKEELQIKKALRFIEERFDSAITIEDIASSAGMSVSTCLRLFHNVLNTTPIRHLIKYRLQKAQGALSRTDGKTIAEVAYSCGFSDASYFNRRFRKEYHMTPSECLSQLMRQNADRK